MDKVEIEENAEIEARRSQPLRGDILNQIIFDLIHCPIVIADITDKNPNVFWELGVRQSFKSGTITIAENDTTLPFDIITKSTLYYHPNDHLKLETFRKDLKNAIRDCLEHPETIDSRVLEVIGGRGTLFEITRRDDTIRRLDALISEITYNIEFLNDVKTDARSTIDKRNEHGFTDLQFRTAALELLVTERYLEETESFYNLLDGNLYQLTRMNRVLQDLRHEKEGDAWMLHFYPNLNQFLNAQLKIIVRVREKVKSKT